MAQSSKLISSNVLAHDFSVNFTELCKLADMSADYLEELIINNIIKPISGETPENWRFSGSAVKVVNKAIRLHQDLEIEWADIALVVDLLDEIDQLESENRQLKKQMNRLLAFKL